MNRFKLISIFGIILFQFQIAEISAQISSSGFRIYNKNQESLSYYIFSMSKRIMIIDNFGTPVFLKEFDDEVLNFSKQEDGYLYYFPSNKNLIFKLDSSYQIIDTLKIKNGYKLNFHEFKVKENGDIYFLGFKLNVMDLSTIYPGGSKFATVIEDVIQVLDKNENVKFEWKSLDHTEILDADSNFVNFTSNYIDYMHTNSFDIDDNGDIYISGRHLNEIIKINGITGDVIWKLGGKKNEFSLIGDSVFFSGQHSIKYVPDGRILLFDNGNIYHSDYSRGVEYLINEDLKTIELNREFFSVSEVYSSIMGNIQLFENENVVVGWGRNRYALLLTEYDNENNLVLKIESAENKYTYRITRIDWKTNIFKSNKDTVDFGEVNYGSSAIQQLVITNNSANSLELSSYSTRGDVFTILNEFPLVIPARGNITLNIKFKPSRYGFNLTDVLTINSYGTDNLGNPQQIAIQVRLKGFSEDTTPPLITTYPVNNSKDISTNTHIRISFDEPVRSIDNNELAVEQIRNSIEFSKGDISGEDVLYDLDYIAEDNEILLYPLSLLEFNENYSLSIYPFFEDFSDNIIAEEHIQFSTGNSTNVNLISNDGLKVFPNPSLDRISISSSNQSIKGIEIRNLNGEIAQKLTELNEMDIVVCIDEQLSGIYILKVIFNDGSIVRRRIVKI